MKFRGYEQAKPFIETKDEKEWVKRRQRQHERLRLDELRQAFNSGHRATYEEDIIDPCTESEEGQAI